MKWAMELSEFDIVYQLRLAIKEQVLADFIAELSNVSETCTLDPSNQVWIMETDGSSKRMKGGAKIILQSSDGLQVA